MSFSTPSYITREALAKLLLQSSPGSSVAVVDVRDGDHVGGHIKGSQHEPSRTVRERIPQLVRALNAKDKVVFHCALSQQRGPDAARWYLWEREKAVGIDQASSSSSSSAKQGAGGGEEEGVAGQGRQGKEQGKGATQLKAQEVLILDGGFTRWQEKYGPDPRLTENFDAEVWSFGS